MTNPLAQDLGGVVRLLEDMTPGDLIVYDANEGDGWPPRPLWCFKNEAYDSGEEPALQGGIHYGGKEDADAIAAAVNFLRAHSAEIAGALRDVERWQPIESAPRDGSYILVCNSHGSWIAKYHPVYPSGYRPSNPWASMMLNHDHIEKPGRFDHPTHWRPLPPPQEASKNGI